MILVWTKNEKNEGFIDLSYLRSLHKDYNKNQDLYILTGINGNGKEFKLCKSKDEILIESKLNKIIKCLGNGDTICYLEK